MISKEQMKRIRELQCKEGSGAEEQGSRGMRIAALSQNSTFKSQQEEKLPSRRHDKYSF